ncbi:hypothetical protein E4U55_004109 [Claviceps digitariae]|nr:hypothetical protein E4U55_004109 [Claviceps digitariae]
MQESATRDNEARRLDSSDQTPGPVIAAPNKMSSATGLGDQGQLSPAHSSNEAPSRQFLTEAAMASQLAQKSHQGAFDLTLMRNAMPTMSHRPPHIGQYMHVSSHPYNLATSPPMAHQPPPAAAYGGQPLSISNLPYYVTQTQMYSYYHGNHLPYPSSQAGMHGQSNMVYYPNQMIMDHTQSSFFYPQGGQYPQQMVPAHVPSGLYTSGASKPDARIVQYRGEPPTRNGRSQGSTSYALNLDAQSSKHNAVRGPPRKPRQSGHALWIGNLPPQTDLMALVEHICKETIGMESLFLISKSNCAFANYKDEVACSTAQQKLHDSKFQSVRLVSRLRRNAAEGISGSTVPTGPAPAPSAASLTSTNKAESEIEASIEESKLPGADCSETASFVAQPTQDVQIRSNTDKFFILKSLTTEDLDLSVKTGIWATQSHNEESLNRAFQSVDNVYLIFSANKSGEYFGYARMMSKMDEDPAAAIEFAPKAMMASEVDLPRAIPTDASEFSPKGKIIDDSARGTIFWEAERDDLEAVPESENETRSEQSGATEEEVKTWGKPFKLEWLSTTRLPFFRTRGLRNPWNSNREVKIARDGTELEPSVGRRLVGLFNRVQNSASCAPVDRPPPYFVPVYPATQAFEQ